MRVCICAVCLFDQLQKKWGDDQAQLGRFLSNVMHVGYVLQKLQQIMA